MHLPFLRPQKDTQAPDRVALMPPANPIEPPAVRPRDVVRVRLSHGRLSLRSHVGTKVELGGTAILDSNAEGWSVREQLQGTLQSGEQSNYQLWVPDGWTVDIRLDEGSLDVGSFRGTLLAYIGVGKLRTSMTEGVLRLSVPDGSVVLDRARGDIEARTSHGSITARDLTGSLLAMTGSGPVTVSDFQGSLQVRTVSGPLSVVDLNDGRARLGSQSGTVSIKNARAQLLVRTVTGDVEFDSVVLGHTSIETSRGLLQVQLADGSNARIEATARSGLVRADRLALTGVTTRRQARAVLGQGEARMRLDAGRGLVELKGPPPHFASSA